ncbi:hypothetical protein NDU88_010935 [Pleurodeles waltl]|uniref:Uncharacterized protein n=1 Tax=Pleurodeles waltl TaxID=8319 RepID=A0AAV7Q3C6_PLEWA|nr:hypothetical protein NDU88_010935 [Pleurodeles waltl]
MGPPLRTRDVQESGIGSLAPERTSGLPSRSEPRPQVRQNTADGRAQPARAGEAPPPEGALVRGTGGREPPLRGGEAGIEPRSVPKTQRELGAPSGGGSEPPFYWESDRGSRDAPAGAQQRY